MLNLYKNYYKGISYFKSISNIADGVILNTVNNLIYKEHKRDLKEYILNLKTLKPKIDNLIDIDSKNLTEGLYPNYFSFFQESYLRLTVFPFLLLDSIQATKRRIKKEHKKFDLSLKNKLKEYPEYYSRNFHYQTNGYLSEKSAFLYNYQVDILFAGLADIMRRQLIALVKKNTVLGKKIKILEIGAGSGELSKYLAGAFPEAEIVCIDLSDSYIAKAKKDLNYMNNLTFMKMNGELLDFKNDTFDLVVSCYMFHELPHEVRIKILNESNRVLKTNGVIAIADSLQEDDDKDLNWALDKFPIDFHEPFFKNYVQSPLKEDIKKTSLNFICEDFYFLTKVILAKK